MISKAFDRIVVKVGSNVLTNTDGTLNIIHIKHIVQQVATLHNNGTQVVLVSSGAVAAGKSTLHINKHLDTVAARQLYSAVGQVKLINHYDNLFQQHSITAAQVLSTKENFASRYHYLNQKNCFETMLDNHVLPIVNENDTVAVSELMFTDNDELAGLVATMLNADALILLTNVDGVLDSGTQTTLPNVIPIISQTTNLNHVLSTGTSAFGRGGMLTKCNIARKVALHGVKVFIANGNKQFIINDILYNNATCTQFVTANKHVSSVKKWIANAGDLANGEVHIDQGAEDALYKNTASSILTIGVTKLTGHFKKGDIVSIVNPKQQIIGLGRIELDANKATPLIRKHHKKPLIHYNYLYLHNNITL